MRTAFVALTLATLVQAQTTLTPLLSGFVYQPDSKTLHAVRGVPGSAYISEPVTSGLDAAWPAPAGAIGIGRSEGQTVLLTELHRSRPVTEPLAQALQDVSDVVWSAKGTKALLVTRTQLQAAHVAAGSMQAEPSVSTSFLGPVDAVAISETGEVALAANSGIYIRTTAGLKRIVDVAGVKFLRFAPDGSLYAAQTDRLVRIAADRSSSTEIVLEKTDIAGFEICSSGNIHVADAAQPAVLVLGPQGERIASIALDRRPSGLRSLAADTLLLLNRPEAGQPAIVLQLLDTPTVWFIPAEAGTL